MSAPFLLVLRIGLTLSLYAFISWALFMLWRSLREQSQVLATRKTPSITLSILAENAEALNKEFNQPEITIGRDPHCEISLESETVSALHARLTYHHGQWWLDDLDSTNGTTLNQETMTTPTVVISGDTIGCGNTRINILLGKDKISSPTEQI